MAHVMQPIGLTKKLKGLQIPGSSSDKANGHGSTAVLKVKTHLTLFKRWPDMRAKHRKQLSKNNLLYQGQYYILCQVWKRQWKVM